MKISWEKAADDQKVLQGSSKEAGHQFVCCSAAGC
jgi:hypothetical protein